MEANVSQPPCTLVVQTLTGKQFPVVLEESTTMNLLWQEIEKEEHTPLTHQSLIWNGIVLDLPGTCRLVDVGITKNGSMLYLVNTQRDASSQLKIATITTESSVVSIPDTGLRSISLKQLKEVAIQIILRCEKEGWTSTNPATRGQPLRPEDVTLYDLAEHYIIPMTQSQQCSYVELVANGPRKPDWFVSHWWGDSVLRSLACLEQHARGQYNRLAAADEISYWICAYANNQHNLQDDITQKLTDSSFYRAMRRCQGTISVMDPHRVCFSRIWCSFEISLTLRDIHKLRPSDCPYRYAVYALKTTPNNRHNRCVGLVDDGYKDDHKAYFQNDFPSCPEMLDICVEKANASKEADKRNILNYIIAGDNTDNKGNNDKNTDGDDPPSHHVAYDEINKLLRGKIALYTYRVALMQGNQPMDKYRQATSQHPSLQKLAISFAYCDPFRDEACHFMATALPTTLQTLQLDLSYLGFESSEEFAQGLSRLTNLQTLVLIVGHCEELTSLECLFEELGQLSSLEYLELQLESCTKLESVDSLGCAIPKITNLKTLKLNVNDCESIASLAGLTQHVWGSTFHRLHLDAGDCTMEQALDFCHRLWKTQLDRACRLGLWLMEDPDPGHEEVFHFNGNIGEFAALITATSLER